MFRILPLTLTLFLAPLALAAPTATIADGKIVVAGLTSPKGLSVVVAEGTEADIAGRPAMAGEWTADKDRLTFAPKYPLRPGTAYRVLGTDQPLDVRVPKAERTKPTVVTRILPTTAELPENVLRFYIEFNQSMPRGDVYRYVRVLTEKGTPVEQPFLELDDELWNPDQTRLTLFIDPGRIKREVKPLLDLGPVFRQGGKFTLVISGKWPTLDGQPLGEDVRKSIAVGAPLREGIDPKAWKLSPPAGEKEPVTVKFGRALDHHLLMRSLAVIGPDGKPVAGKGEAADSDRGWMFRPAAAWAAGEYKLRVDTVLEDVCGNCIGQPFEIDVRRPTQPREVKEPHLDLPFTVGRR